MSETDPITVTDYDGGSSVNIDVARHQVAETIAQDGHRPTGQFWASLVEYAFPQASELELVATPTMFSARGDRSILETLAPWLDGYLSDPSALLELVGQARQAGVDLEG